MNKQDELKMAFSAMACLTFPSEIEDIYNLIISMANDVKDLKDQLHVPYDYNEMLNAFFQHLPNIMEIHHNKSRV